MVVQQLPGQLIPATELRAPGQAGLRAALRLALGFAAAKLLLHIAAAAWQQHIGYGHFRDEFYYVLCGRRLAWGYVDHGPLVALQARLAETLFGGSIVGLRVLSALGGALRVALTGILCWSLGGRRPAQALAMLFVVVAPIYLGIDGILSMNSWESAFWMTCVLALIRLAGGGRPTLWWTVFGISAGLGYLNKLSIVFFLAALLSAVLAGPQRRLLASRWAVWGVGLAALIALPNLVWQWQHHWPTLEFLQNGRAEGKNLRLAPLPFILNQLLVLGPLGALVWVAGLVHLMRSSAVRWLGSTYLIFLAGMIALGAKDYYVAPVYPLLFAAGGVAWERRFAHRPRVRDGRVLAWPALSAVVLLGCVVLLPASVPVLAPDAYVRYAQALHLPSPDSENHVRAALPQFYADRFGWQELVAQVTAAAERLAPAERARAGILVDNYGEAGALEFLGHGLPPVASGHNNYWLWGPHGIGADVLIVVSGDAADHFQPLCRQVETVGNLDHPWAMPFERRKRVYLLRGCSDAQSPALHWADYKHYD